MASNVFFVYGSTGQQQERVTGTGSTDHDRLAKVQEIRGKAAPHHGLETAKGTTNGRMTLQFPNMELLPIGVESGHTGLGDAVQQFPGIPDNNHVRCKRIILVGC